MHINGALSKLKQSITSDFVLTSSSYATQAFSQTPWATIFRNDLQQSKHLIFIGYSLADIDIARLIFDPSIFLGKVHFVDRVGIDPVLNSKLAKFGSVHPIGLESLAKLIQDERKNWVKPDFVESYQCWQKVRIESGPRTPSDDDFYELVLQGVCKDGLLLNQLETPDSPTYAIVRNCELLCMQHLGEASAVAALIGSFANGKTIAARAIALKIAAAGKDVFVLDHPYESAYAELQKLCRRTDDFVLIIENYSRHLDLVECFNRYARPECGLMVTERTEIHELSSSALSSQLEQRNTRIFELDLLENDELSRVSALLDYRGLWGERVGLSDIQRMSFLRDDCGRQLQAVLLEVAKSPQVKKKLANLVAHFEAIEGGMRVLIGLCLMQSIGELPRIDVLSELLGLDYEAFNRLKKVELTKQIFSTQSGVANFRSPVMASAVLSGLPDAASITCVVAECVKHGYLARKADPYLGEIAKELMRFGNLERILPGRGKREALQNLYEDLKSIKVIRENPHLWLQYAMARLSLGELDTARRYFAESYSYASRIPHYDTFQIDNHYCRLLLREAEDTSDQDAAFKSVDEALTTLKKQVLRENRHYPYRSAWNLEAVVKRHGSNWTDAQKKVVVDGANYLINAAARLEANVARSVAVVGGLKRLNTVIRGLSN